MINQGAENGNRCRSGDSLQKSQIPGPTLPPQVVASSQQLPRIFYVYFIMVFERFLRKN